MQFELSERLKTVAECVTRGNAVADIGTDHGYLPIYLCTQQIAPYVIGMDVNKGPLSRAAKNIGGLSGQIELRLSDGLAGLKPQEVQTVTICGMGGKLMERILTEGEHVITSDMEIILSPQSELMHFRAYLELKHYCVVQEHIVLEDGKFYFIMKCRREAEKENAQNTAPKALPVWKCTEKQLKKMLQQQKDFESFANLTYGTYLLEHPDDTLAKLIELDRQSLVRVREQVASCESQHRESRLAEIDFALKAIAYAQRKAQEAAK